jgi:sulfur-oxidizing protein SoxY
MQRRSFLRGLGLVAAASAVITPSMVMAAEAPTGPNALTIEAALQAITGGKAVVVSPLVHLKAPEIAENGAVVPVTIEVDSPMTEVTMSKQSMYLLQKTAMFAVQT